MAEAEPEAMAEQSAEAEAGVDTASEGTAKGNPALAPTTPSPPEAQGGSAPLSGSDPTIGSVAPTDASAQAPAVSATVSPPVPSALVLRFAKDCWVDIRDADGASLAYGVMKAGSVSELSGAAPFSLVLGNAPAATIEINGETVSKSVYVPPRGTVSRFVLAAPTPET
jgi:cytoskeleton protein RodZ